ncbi:PASTA domain-containing protein [Nocardia sp. NPDC055321]
MLCALTACATTTAPAGTSTTAPPAAPPAITATSAPAALPAPATLAPGTAAPTTSAPAAAPAALMPSVVCMNLQAAQDTIQEAGVFFSRSKDATGADRMQVIDSNWVVVAQSPAPGTPFTEGEAVLSVVKIGEPSQC